MEAAKQRGTHRRGARGMGRAVVLGRSPSLPDGRGSVKTMDASMELEVAQPCPRSLTPPATAPVRR